MEHPRCHEVRPPEHPPGGTTYLLLHGLGGSLEQWREVLPVLGEVSRAVSVDVPGFGGSRAQRGGFSVDSAAQRLRDFCAAKSIDNAILVSHSIGGVVASRLAALAPERFTRVVLVSGALHRAALMAQHPGRAFRHPVLAVAVAAQFLAGMLPVPNLVLRAVTGTKLLRRLILWPFVHRPSELDGARLYQALQHAGSLAVVRVLLTAGSIDYHGIMSSVPHPVDLVWGDHDRLITTEDIEATRRLVAVGRELRIADCGHWPPVEAPAAVAEFLLAAGA